MIRTHGSAVWADIDGLTRTILYDRTTPDSTYCRFFFNQIAESSDGWMSKAEWDSRYCEDDPITPGDQIATIHAVDFLMDSQDQRGHPVNLAFHPAERDRVESV